MLASIALAGVLTAPPLVTNAVPHEKRVEVLRNHFNPPLETSIEIDERDIQRYRSEKKRDRLQLAAKRDFMKMRGHIWVKPPAGKCFLITRNEDREDDFICKPTELSFNLGDLDETGRLTWFIRTGKGDFGANYSWPSPYRFAQVVRSLLVEDIPTVMSHAVPVRRCIAHTSEDIRRIVLELFDGQEWSITLPQNDTVAASPTPPPNLFVQKPYNAGGITAERRVGGPKFNYTYRSGSPKDDPTKYWAISDHHSFKMSSTNFRINDHPPGMQGQCRYQFKGAQREPENGWVECHHVDMYDVVLVRTPCIKQLARK